MCKNLTGESELKQKKKGTKSLLGRLHNMSLQTKCLGQIKNLV